MYDAKYMTIALEEAQKAFLKDEVPVGAVIVKNGEIIAKSHNMLKNNNNVLNHAEIGAIIDASSNLKDWRLNDCEMYVTLEPCPMCSGAILNSRIKKIYIGAYSNIPSNRKVIDLIFHNSDYYHYVDVEYVNSNQASEMLKMFFAKKR